MQVSIPRARVMLHNNQHPVFQLICVVWQSCRFVGLRLSMDSWPALTSCWILHSCSSCWQLLWIVVWRGAVRPPSICHGLV